MTYPCKGRGDGGYPEHTPARCPSRLVMPDQNRFHSVFVGVVCCWLLCAILLVLGLVDEVVEQMDNPHKRFKQPNNRVNDLQYSILSIPLCGDRWQWR